MTEPKTHWPNNLWRNRKLTDASLADLRNAIIAALLCVTLLAAGIYVVVLFIAVASQSKTVPGPNTTCPPGQTYAYTLGECT